MANSSAVAVGVALVAVGVLGVFVLPKILSAGVVPAKARNLSAFYEYA